MAFHEVRFPTGISYGAKAGPGFNTAIIEKDSGQEERVSRWQGMRHTYDVSHGIKSVDQAAAVLDFHVCRSGAAHGFRFQDPADHATTVSHSTFGGQTVTALDEQIGIGDGVTTSFQLLTTYTSLNTVTRFLKKPVQGTVRLAVGGVVKTENVDFTVNYTTGLVTFTTAPVLSAVITAGCEYDTPARFGEDVDKQLPFTIEAFDGSSIPQITIVELMDESPDADDYWYGGGTDFGALSANVTVTTGNGRSLSFFPQVPSLKIFLPNAATTAGGAGGGPVFFLANQSNTTSMLVRDHLDAAVATLAPLAMLTMVIAPDSGGTQRWLGA